MHSKRHIVNLLLFATVMSFAASTLLHVAHDHDGRVSDECAACETGSPSLVGCVACASLEAPAEVTVPIRVEENALLPAATHSSATSRAPPSLHKT